MPAINSVSVLLFSLNKTDTKTNLKNKQTKNTDTNNNKTAAQQHPKTNCTNLVGTEDTPMTWMQAGTNREHKAPVCRHRTACSALVVFQTVWPSRTLLRSSTRQHRAGRRWCWNSLHSRILGHMGCSQSWTWPRLTCCNTRLCMAWGWRNPVGSTHRRGTDHRWHRLVERRCRLSLGSRSQRHTGLPAQCGQCHHSTGRQGMGCSRWSGGAPWSCYTSPGGRAGGRCCRSHKSTPQGSQWESPNPPGHSSTRRCTLCSPGKTPWPSRSGKSRWGMGRCRLRVCPGGSSIHPGSLQQVWTDRQDHSTCLECSPRNQQEPSDQCHHCTCPWDRQWEWPRHCQMDSSDRRDTGRG